MSSGTAWSVALLGLAGTLVEVEAAIGAGLPRTILVGLPDTSLYEARDRCKAAVATTGIGWPSQLLTINLTPASLPKAGTHFDLAIVAAVWAAAGAVPSPGRRVVMFGELGLDGRVRAVRGVLPALLAARDAGVESAIVPAAQVAEAQLVEGLTVWGVSSLADLIEVLNGRPPACPAPRPQEVTRKPTVEADMADFVGQPEARWALEVAAAGRHHLYLAGPPGVGKTMLAERLPGLLPPLTTEEALEVCAVHSLAGVELGDAGLPTRAPYADPHHAASMASIVGGGQRFARPGAVSLAHRGVLFLDEAPEFSRRVLEALRTPLESGSISLGRANGQATYPARFQLVLAANPCPCGNAGVRGVECRCAPMAVRRYRDRLSGPILDRIDVRLALSPLRQGLLREALAEQRESSTVIAGRVAEARERQRRRLGATPWRTNAEVSGPWLRTMLESPQGLEVLDAAIARGQLSPRGADKVIRIAWTLADLAGRERPSRDDLRAALLLRLGDADRAVAA